MEQELLFEIGTEEIPAGYIMPAVEQMQRILGQRLKELGLAFAGLKGVATPRRLTVCVTGLAARQPDRREEMLGPPKQAAFDADNKPTKAALGFAKSKGLTIDDLRVVSTPKGEYLMAVVEEKGRATEEILTALLPEIVGAIPFPKSMRWGEGRTHFARPIQWLLTMYGGKAVPCRIDTLESGTVTHGHRFMAPAALETSSFAQYQEALRQARVLVDPAERREAVLEEINRAAGAVGGRILPDDELVDTVTNLVESPHAICGSFEERFLALPKEVLITSMREHQKYFAVVDGNDHLLPYFVAVNNTKVKDERLGAKGHQRVLRARLEDAFFFFKEDQTRPLTDKVMGLSGVIFQARLGTLLEKVERITILAGQLAKALAPDTLGAVQRAAHLAKADLLTDMVNEFPSLQGVVGRAYALLNGEPPEVATAIWEHYLPVRAGGELPAEIPGALVGIADRLDTIVGCFGIGQTPTGTTDPFGLRRQALGLLHIIGHRKFSLALPAWVDESLRLYGGKLTVDRDQARRNILEFIKGRFVHDLASQGIPLEAVEAVTSVSFVDVADCRRRIDALVAISAQPAFTVLAGSFKRVINIIKESADTKVDEALLTERAEKDLFNALRKVSAEAHPLLEAEEYEKALHVILKMKEPVDTFFDKVMVMVEEERLRRNRLALLAAIAELFLRIGDFSKMYALNH